MDTFMLHMTDAPERPLPVSRLPCQSLLFIKTNSGEKGYSFSGKFFSKITDADAHSRKQPERPVFVRDALTVQ